MGDAGWQWSVVTEHAGALGQAAAVTVLLSVITIVAGTALGILLGVALASRSAWARVAAWLVAVPMGLAGVLPIVVLLLWLHHAVPQSSAWLHEAFGRLAAALGPGAGAAEAAVLEGVASRPFATATLGLTIVLTAAVGGIVRSGIAAVPATLVDAAKSQGMGRVMRMRRVILPEALRAGVVPLLTAYLSTFRLTTLAAFIGCNELVLVAYTMGTETSHDRELLTVLALAYMAFLLPATFVVKHLERSRWITRQ
jgi:polar amino acid transport system permease protein